MKSRTCKVCKGAFPEDTTHFRYFTHPTRVYLDNACRPCRNAISRLQKNRRYHEDEKYREAIKQRWRKTYYKTRPPGGKVPAEQMRVNQLVHRALNDKTLKKCPCLVCGNRKAQAHHDDYSKPLDVHWLCRLHHGERHRLLNRNIDPVDWPGHWPESSKPAREVWAHWNRKRNASSNQTGGSPTNRVRPKNRLRAAHV